VGVPGVITPTAFDLGPDGLVFSEPVIVTLSYDQVDVPATTDETTLFIVATSHTSGELEPVPGSTVDPDANTVTAPISGFSTVMMALPNCPAIPWCPPREASGPPAPDDPGGDLDAAFGSAGTFRFELGRASSTGVSDLLIDDQGRLLVGASELRMSVIRVLPDGQGLDPDFGFGGVAAATTTSDSLATAIALRTDGRIVLLGARQPAGGGLDLLLARFLPSGLPDPSFGGGDGIVLDLRQGIRGVGDVATLPDGRILAVDLIGSLYQYLADGSPDPGFGVNGLAQDPALGGTQVLRRASGDWLLATGHNIQEADAQGNPGRRFFGGSGGPTLAAGFQELFGARYVIGGFQQIGSGLNVTFDAGVSRLRPGEEAGSLEADPGFALDGAFSYDFGGSEFALDSAVQADGRVVLVGATRDRGDDDDLFVVRIRPDGFVDGGFGDNGIVYLDFGGDEADGAVAIDDQGRIVVVGSSRIGDSFSGDRFGVMARILP